MSTRAGYTLRGSWTHLVRAADEPSSSSVWFDPMPGWTEDQQFRAIQELDRRGVDLTEVSEGGSPEWGPSALVWMNHFAISPTTSGDAFVLDSDAESDIGRMAASLPEYPTALEAVTAYFEGALS